MSGGDLYLLLCSLAGVLMIPIGLWMKLDLDRLDRKIERLEAEAAARRATYPAE